MDHCEKPLEVVGKGATATIYRDGGRAIKRYENESLASVEREAEMQSFAHAAGLPVPKVWSVRKAGERAILLEMDYVPGAPLLRTDMDRDAQILAFRALVGLQCKVHAVSAEGLLKQSERLAWRIQRSPDLDESLKARLLVRLRQLDDGSARLCHGDFHPLNVLDDGHRLWIIDWVDATAGSPLADACRSYLIIKQYQAPAAETYLQLFCEASGAIPERVLDWLPVLAAARLSESMDPPARDFLKALAAECPAMDS
ncbi:MAG TPA: aminoglycoside phosphotransferase family protein [Clostridia bacterium]|nr:aminoglycoside phosphotransferase family protein [Clostridia bacterium]